MVRNEFTEAYSYLFHSYWYYLYDLSWSVEPSISGRTFSIL